MVSSAADQAASQTVSTTRRHVIYYPKFHPLAHGSGPGVNHERIINLILRVHLCTLCAHFHFHFHFISYYILLVGY